MTKEFIFDKFCEMFPDFAKHTVYHKKIGSRMISVSLDTVLGIEKITFLYNSPTDWNLGTKPWRRKPGNVVAHPEEPNSHEKPNV